MKVHIKKIALKIVKWTGITIAFLLLLLFLIPLLFPGKVEREVKRLGNNYLAGELNFKRTRLSFFTHFPSLTVSMDELTLMGSAPYANDTLIAAKQVACGINLKRLIFDNEVKVDELYVNEALIDVMVDSLGKANYNVFISNGKSSPKDPNAPEKSTAIKLDRIDFKDCHVRYNDKSAKMLVDARGFNYLGKGGLSQDVFDLTTDCNIDSLDFTYNQTAYLEKKNFHADLITRVNTNALSFILQKNELRINELPVEFTGFFTILRDGYKINIDAASKNTTLADILSVLPPSYLGWLKDTKIKGDADLLFNFRGEYNASVQKQPSLGFKLKVRDGYAEYKGAPVPLSGLQLDMAAVLPGLNLDRLAVNIKTFNFKLGEKDYFTATLQSKGMRDIALNARAKGTLNLQTLDRALGIQNIDMRGNLVADIAAAGSFNSGKKLFPKTKGGLSLQNGWLKTSYYPNPITDIKFVANVVNNAGTYQDLKVAVTPASFVFEGNPVYVNATVSDFEDMYYKAIIKGEVNVGRIYKVFAKKGLNVSGYAKADLNLNGRQSYATTGQYDKLDNKGTILLKDIKAKSALFPKSFLLNEGHFRFENEKMWFEKFIAHYGKSDFAINGYLLNTINYFLESHGTLAGNFNMKSKLINVDEFMSLKGKENNAGKPQTGTAKAKSAQIENAKATHPAASGVVVLPHNLNVSLIANADKVAYNGLLLNKLIGKVAINKGQFYLDKTTFEIIGCTVGVDARYDDETPLTANFDAHLTAKDFSVERAYKEIPMFHDMVSAAEKAKGIISLDYKIKGDLNANMGPIYESLEGGGTINLRDVQVSGLKLFGSISEKTGQDGLNNPRMKGININSHINNNLIHIEPFTLRVSLFRPTIKGTTSFDGLLDLRIRLGLPPAGLIGIPIAVTGTHENPKIKIFSKTGQKIDDAVYDEKHNKVIKEEKRDPKDKS